MAITEQGLKTTLGIIGAAGSLLSKDNYITAGDADIKKMGGKIIGHAANAQAITKKANDIGGSLTRLTNQTTILSRAFVDESILDEAVLPNLMRSVHSWYTAQVISSLHLGQMVSDSRTVQDVMSVVQTGHNDRSQGMFANIANRMIGQESFLQEYLGLESDGTYHNHPPTYEDIKKSRMSESDRKEYERQERMVTDHWLKRDLADQTRDEDRERDAKEKIEDHHLNEQLKNRSAPNEHSIRSVNTSENRVGPMGEMYEIKLTNPNGNGQSVTVPVFIQMQPSLIPGDIAPRFIDMNVQPSWWQRWTQYRAGEITFMKDFLLSVDLHKRMRTTLKNPAQAKAFTDFLRTVAKKDKYAAGDLTDKLSAAHSHNLANSVVVFSEDTVAQAKADSGIDLHNLNDRVRYFRDTYTMIIAIIDPLHQRVTVYFNGVDGQIETSYNEFRPKDKNFDPKDLVATLQALSAGNISRLR